MLFKAFFKKNLLLAQGNEHITNKQFVFQNGPSIFRLCFSFICGTLKTKTWASREPSFDSWRAKMSPGALCGSGRAHFGKGQVLSVSVVCGGCHGGSYDVLNDFFLCCVFERHNHRVVVDCGKSSVVAIFVLPMTAVAIFRCRKISCAERTVLVAKIPTKTLKI